MLQALCLFLATTLAQGEQVKRTTLPNGAVVYVEAMPSSRTLSVQLFISSRNVEETARTHGWRHLYEHLAARGDGSLDQELEQAGAFLRPETGRDAMQFELILKPEQLDLGLRAVKKLLEPLAVTQETIDAELKILKQEFALRSDAERIADACWTAAYGELGLNAGGDLETLARVTPDDLKDLQKRMLTGDHLTLCIVGPIDAQKALELGSQTLKNIPSSQNGSLMVRSSFKPGRVEAEAFGEARGVAMPRFDQPEAAARLMAALALASEFQSGFVTYTPGADLIILGRTDANSGLGLLVDSSGDPATYYYRGQALARAWVLRQLQTASGSAALRGRLMNLDPTFKPETMLAQIDKMGYSVFLKALEAFKKDQAVTAVGAK